MSDPELSKAIRACISIGSGSLKDFSVNGKIIHKLVTWKKHCIIDPLYGGLVCDLELKTRMSLNDTWSAREMKNKGVVFNSIDSSLIENLEEVKRKSKKRGEIVY